MDLEVIAAPNAAPSSIGIHLQGDVFQSVSRVTVNAATEGFAHCAKASSSTTPTASCSASTSNAAQIGVDAGTLAGYLTINIGGTNDKVPYDNN